MATRVHQGIHAFIVHVHSHTLLTLYYNTPRLEALWGKKLALWLRATMVAFNMGHGY